MDIRPIKSPEDHAWGLREIEAGMKADLQPGTPKGDRLEIIMTLVEAYEREHFPIPPADPIEAVKFRMEQQRLQPSDLLSVFGTRGRASEILQRKRRMSLNIIRALSSTRHPSRCTGPRLRSQEAEAQPAQEASGQEEAHKRAA
jgi:HTH-type transcriptional regulator/antitoxin HigA